MKKEPREKTADEKERHRLLRPALVAQRKEELAYLYGWLVRIHPEQLREASGKQVGLSDYIRENLDVWAVRR